VVDSSGTVYVVWESCTLEPSCTNNDILFSTSTTGLSWTPPAMIPINASGSGIDNMVPGIGVDRATSGGTAHLGVVYYAQSASCTSSCTLSVGFIGSTNGGSTWSAAVQLAGPFGQTWFADSSQGRMVGDYNSVSFLNGKAYPVFATATAPSASTFSERMTTIKGGFSVSAGSLAAITGRASAAVPGNAQGAATAR
jgi:hypothetical protein